MSGVDVNVAASPLATAEVVAGMPTGVLAFTTTRAAGSFGLGSDEPVGVVMERWHALEADLAQHGVVRLASAHQVHGADVVRHRGGWQGWLRQRGVDGHITDTPGTALAVTIADCTPVFIAHPSGVIAALHAGWRGTAARILDVGLDAMAEFGCPSSECQIHLGPSICGDCYEVGPEVIEAMTGARPAGKQQLDVRAVLLDQASRRGVKDVSISALCTRHHNERLFSHRADDAGRLLGVIALAASEESLA